MHVRDLQTVRFLPQVMISAWSSFSSILALSMRLLTTSIMATLNTLQMLGSLEMLRDRSISSQLEAKTNLSSNGNTSWMKMPVCNRRLLLKIRAITLSKMLMRKSKMMMVALAQAATMSLAMFSSKKEIKEAAWMSLRDRSRPVVLMSGKQSKDRSARLQTTISPLSGHMVSEVSTREAI